MSEQAMGATGDIAIETCRRAVEASPGSAELRINLGNAYWEARRLPEALACFDEAIRLDPAEFMGHGSRAMLLDELRQTDAAIESYQHAIALRPNSLEAINNLWILLRETGRADEALALAERAQRSWPDSVRVMMMLASTLAALHQHEEAEPLLQRALVLAGAEDRAALFQAIGLSRYLENRADEAIGFFDQALSAMPNNEQLRLHRALALIVAGRYEQGWAELEWRLACRSFADIPRVRNRPAWDGGDPAGKTILILAEQGLGDTIQFARYGTLLARRGGRVVLACQEPLVDLMRSMEGLAQVVGLGERLPTFDAYVHCMSLPHRFGTTLATVPAETPYLRARPEDVARWGERLKAKAGARRRVAFAWAGKATHLRDRFRSMRVSQLEPLFPVGDAAWFSVQKGPASQQLREIGAAENVIDFSDEIESFGDTAAILSQVDLVVTVDTAVAHLAGALNVPTWVMMPFSPDCRWLLGREDTPWYPSMRLFRQDKPGDWGPVIERVRAELAKIFAK